MVLNFSEFKNKFYSRIDDMSVFDCEEFNIMKVVLDGLKVNYFEKGKHEKRIFDNIFVTKTVFLLKRIKFKTEIDNALLLLENIKKQTRNKKEYILLDNGRTVINNNGEDVSFYFDNIKRFLGEEKYFLLYNTDSRLKNALKYNDLLPLNNMPFSGEDITLINSLRATYKKISEKIQFSIDELENIQIAISKFFFEYRIWAAVISESGFKYCVFNTHYHKEGTLLAFRRKKIKLIELQHGLIAKEDIFYIFPETIKKIASRALFPDKIFTYSKYWANELKGGAEFIDEQIDVIGQYQVISLYISETQRIELSDYLGKDQFILFTTQTFLHNYFIKYISWLAQDLSDKKSTIKIIVKLHPSENEREYLLLKDYSNVKIVNYNTEYLLSKCAWHVSIYSTTLYDATKYTCKNYSLNIIQFWEYIKGFISCGVSNILQVEQNPMDLGPSQIRTQADKGLFFENFSDNCYKLLELE